ncbi:hypothetical protein [Vibrio fluvialis]|uniref:hypothetical protein n=1 Tax=Vibrio fluvialis TaxID=676 RepID=UPI0028DFD4F3|nr:hypothetical protein [Vibrio fluvialis]MDT8869191.1 hypothetical protein [Vibrio fluvialis]MDT8876844.1 hypothetical protein [Vibrio fluvialis]
MSECLINILIKNLIKHINRSNVRLVICIILFSVDSRAAVVEFNYVYDGAKKTLIPENNEYVEHRYYGFVLYMEDLLRERSKYINSDGDNIREHWYLGLNTNIKTVQFTNEITGESFKGTFRLNGTQVFHSSGENLNILRSTFYSAEGGCTSSGYGNDSSYTISGVFPEGVTECYKWLPSDLGVNMNLMVHGLNADVISTIESPEHVSSGRYTATVVYEVGEGGDIDPGDTSDPETVELRFAIDVNHDVKVWFPPGSEIVVLEPRGGWLRWLHSGIPPDYIGSDVNFYLETSGPLAVTLVCDPEYVWWNYPGCALKGTMTVPLDISISIPGMTHQSSAVERLLLRRDNPVVLTPESSMGRRNSVVHFSLPYPESFGNGYRDRQVRSKATLVFDAVIP